METKIFIVLPTYNEKENLHKLVEEIFDLKIPNLQLLIIDDNSPDGTGQIAEELAKKYPIQIIHRSGKLGLGNAYRQGFRIALNQGANLIFEMDADFSHNPKDIPNLIQACRQGADLAIGSRKIHGGKIIGWNWWRKFCSWTAMFFSRLILGLKAKDVTSGFRCYRKEILNKIPFEKIQSNGYAWQEEILLLCQKYGAKIKEIPIIFIDRKRGKSKFGWKEILEFFLTLWRLKLCQKKEF